MLAALCGACLGRRRPARSVLSDETQSNEQTPLIASTTSDSAPPSADANLSHPFAQPRLASLENEQLFGQILKDLNSPLLQLPQPCRDRLTRKPLSPTQSVIGLGTSAAPALAPPSTGDSHRGTLQQGPPSPEYVHSLVVNTANQGVRPTAASASPSPAASRRPSDEADVLRSMRRCTSGGKLSGRLVSASRPAAYAPMRALKLGTGIVGLPSSQGGDATYKLHVAGNAQGSAPSTEPRRNSDSHSSSSAKAARTSLPLVERTSSDKLIPLWTDTTEAQDGFQNTSFTDPTSNLSSSASPAVSPTAKRSHTSLKPLLPSSHGHDDDDDNTEQWQSVPTRGRHKPRQTATSIPAGGTGGFDKKSSPPSSHFLALDTEGEETSTVHVVPVPITPPKASSLGEFVKDGLVESWED